jgi:type IV fimbrial biogenesis protein FimT
LYPFGALCVSEVPLKVGSHSREGSAAATVPADLAVFAASGWLGVSGIGFGMPNCVERKRDDKGIAGKSLAELVIVAAIISIAVAMAVPAYTSFYTGLQGRTAAAEIASTLRMARHLAMARRERLLVRFDLSERIITVRQEDPGGILNVYRYADKGIVVDEPTAGLDLLFHPSGRSASASTIVIYDRDHRRITITVSLTGRVVSS